MGARRTTWTQGGFLWPDFGDAELDAALAVFRARDRRFGGVKEHVLVEPAAQAVNA